MRSIIIVSRAILAALIILPLETYDWFKKNVPAGASSLKIAIAIIILVVIVGFISLRN
jgi:uncharacterized membrane protein (DUF2068 family)